MATIETVQDEWKLLMEVSGDFFVQCTSQVEGEVYRSDTLPTSTDTGYLLLRGAVVTQDNFSNNTGTNLYGRNWGGAGEGTAEFRCE